VLEIVVADSVGQEHGIARLRVLIAAAGAATNLLKVAELEDRLAHVEAAVAHLDAASDDPFDGP
jgi:hypothetical protein